MEKFMAMTVKFPVSETPGGKLIYINFCFRDSYQVLSEGLATLVDNVGEQSVTQTLKMCDLYKVSKEVILAKGVFPYSFFDSFAKMDYARIPDIADFYDTLLQCGIDEDKYKRAQVAWQEFKCKNMGEYMLRYLEMDVLQLCDVYERFREIARREDGLDGAHYLTISQFSLSSALKLINRPIELCPRPEMYRLFEKSIRGGISFCNTHYIKASNPYVNKDQKEVSVDDISILYFDENNLYALSLSQKVPVGSFYKEMNPKEIDWSTIDTEGDTGYLLEVDLEYPKEIHNKTRWFPLAAENLDITHDMITDDMKLQYRELNRARGNYRDSQMPTCHKLVGTCLNKMNYVVHFKILKFYLNQGLRILKI